MIVSLVETITSQVVIKLFHHLQLTQVLGFSIFRFKILDIPCIFVLIKMILHLNIVILAVRNDFSVFNLCASMLPLLIFMYEDQKRQQY